MTRLYNMNSHQTSHSRSRSRSRSKSATTSNSKGSLANEDQHRTQSEFAKTRATRKIQSVFRQHRESLRSNYLNTVCTNSGVCIAFGKESDLIRRHFKGFSDFSLLSETPKVLTQGSNGYVTALTYKSKGYVAQTILKSTLDESADSILYEAAVGFFLNKYAKQFPIFLETYGLFEYKHNKTMPQPTMHKSNKPNLTMLTDNLEGIFHKSLIKRTCKSPMSMAVLIQHLENADTILNSCKRAHFVKTEFAYSLFQIYAALHSMRRHFTHYDLHPENALVFSPVKGKYIEYVYHMDDKIVQFKSIYMTKLIDYGRCYFNESSKLNGEKIYKMACKEEVCTTTELYEPDDPNEDTTTTHYDCGYKKGFQWLSDEPLDADYYYINSLVANQSHDLRLMYEHNDNIHLPAKLKTIMKSVEYGSGLEEDDKHYGTNEKKTLGYLRGLSYKINNVSDAFYALLDYVADPEIMEQNEKSHSGLKSVGELHIYDDGRAMEYVPRQRSSHPNPRKSRKAWMN